MMTTAHQWEQQDLAAAGLNPILTATGGTPGSYSAAALAPQGEFGEITRNLEGSLSSAKQSAAMKPEIDLIKAQSKQMRALADKTKKEAEAAEWEPLKSRAALDILDAEANLKHNDLAVSNASTINALTREQAQRRMDLTGIKTRIMGQDFELTGEQLRQFNRIIRMLGGKDTTTAQ